MVLFGTGEGATSPAGTDGLLAATVFPPPVRGYVTVGIASSPRETVTISVK